MKPLFCINCDKPLRRTTSTYKGESFSAWECPSCKERLFTEEQAHEVIAALEAKRLQESYQKSPTKIGNSWGITFPKEVVQVFDLSKKKTKLRLRPNVAKNRIVIEIE